MASNIAELYERSLMLATEQSDENIWELARSLHQLHERDKDYYDKVLNKSGLDSRKAYYLMAIYQAFAPLKVSRARLIEVGWTKLKELTKVVNQQNVDDWLEAALNSTVHQLISTLRGDKPKKDARTLVMYLTSSEYGEAHEAFLKHGAKESGRGLSGKEEAFIQIIRMITNQ